LKTEEVRERAAGSASAARFKTSCYGQLPCQLERTGALGTGTAAGDEKLPLGGHTCGQGTQQGV
jgi:hypothetical protein